MDPIYNFCAGPAMLPVPVLTKAQSEMRDWQGLGVSVMEVSHRSPEFIAMANKAEADLRELMHIPDNYHVLFMHGGGRGQFSAVVNNFLGNDGRACYWVSGQWSQAAAAEAVALVGNENIDIIPIVEECDGLNTVVLPKCDEQQQYRYLHYCPNETVDGIEIFDEINCPWPVVADMSSTILSRQIDVSRYGLIYAGAQKNIGPSGLAIVIVRDDMLALPAMTQSAIMDYRLARDNDSMYNTPPTYAWYLAGEVFAWLKALGGVAAIEAVNSEKAKRLYACIEAHALYRNTVAHNNRSHMNVTFELSDDSLNDLFLQQAQARGLVALKGHRLVGGMRASIYNAMPLAGVDALTQFMTEFAKAR
ncbi:3-phosphoserine/phosphohydroxythreonine transaminase [Shewanella sp. NIFS-20-20]|uniref:3-phosphoserine/phosphohydroxythreonine transaminase n=1 Tax=Shewanella sp. NIFS-20-20 TaxID=2853806 RepID=UPI001C49782D|nr:3-phosphoserine/phosphohydroxythreonine transaminase [Shewanella sp. NIFS-20-20]MBV7315235.1 3-phosphoserine/phosphohydroxythreonine transaminase [Shewanella sp. NIFS-20-20]